MNVVVIGCGQLGSRHLQSIANFSTTLNVFAIDPFQASLDVAESRWNEIAGSKNHTIHFSTDYSELPKEIYFAVIATNATVRLESLVKLTNASKVRNLILEKFLFNTKKEFNECSEILASQNIQCWVNCTRRMLESYKNLKPQLKNIETIKYSGENWNMASNAIHFVDIAEYLLEEEFTSIDIDLTTSMLESKRQGYYEFFGKLIFNSPQGKLELVCEPGEAISVKGEIKTSEALYEIAEGKEMKITSKNSENKTQPFPIQYQSSLTEKVLTSLIETNSCNLVDYENAKRQHLLLLDALENYFTSKNEKLCPIT